MSTTVTQSESKPEENAAWRWWFKFVVVPLVGLALGTGGIRALLVDSGKGTTVDPTNTPQSKVEKGSETTVNPSFNSGGDMQNNSIQVAGGDINVLPSEPEALGFNRDIWMSEAETRVVQGITLNTSHILKLDEAGPVAVELEVIDDGVVVVPKTRVVKGKTYAIRKGDRESATVTVKDVVLQYKDPNTTAEDVRRAGLMGYTLLFKSAQLTVAGRTVSPDPPEEIAKDSARKHELTSVLDFTIRTKLLGAIDARQLSDDQRVDFLAGAILENDRHAADVLLRLGTDPNSLAFGETPLHHALYANNLDMFRMLLHRHADPNKKNVKGESVLDCLARKPNVAFSNAVKASGESNSKTLER